MAQLADDSPQIVISYHLADEKWRHRVFTHLDLHVEQLRIVDDRIGARPPGNHYEPPPAALRRAKILILLVSPKYMSSTWLNDDRGSSMVADLSLTGLRTFFLILQKISPEKFPVLHSNYLSQINASPLEKATPKEQDSALDELARQVVAVLERPPAERVAAKTDVHNEPPIPVLSRFLLSREAENALRRARRLATISMMVPAQVTTPALLFGISEGGRAKTDYVRTPQFLWKELTRHGEDVYTKALLSEFTELAPPGGALNVDAIPIEAELVTANALKVFELAEAIGRQTVASGSPRAREMEKRGQASISARHLLAALLVFKPGSSTGAGRQLAAMVRDVAALRNRFYYFIVNSVPADDAREWRQILIDLKLPEIEPATPISPEPPPSLGSEPLIQPTIAGFIADDWQGADLLGIEKDVNALASLVAACKVEPPLSIGLFGDWGSGKSHFMRQMRKRVELQSKLARESFKPQNELGYYKNIVQIEFNAWHYIEGNLWASLVDHIFANPELATRNLKSQTSDVISSYKNSVSSNRSKTSSKRRSGNAKTNLQS